ncbi:MAG: hypothetical protein QME64_02835 [bacterium]|nr:hypothetical protein [bacterium]
MASVSVTQLIGPALTFTKNLLFTRPFSLKKWVKLALVAWLAGEAFVGGSGGGCNFNFPFLGEEKSHPAPLPPVFSDAWRYLLDHIVTIIILVAIIIALLITISLIFAVLRAIFAFIFLDSLKTNQVAVGAGFAQYQWLGWRLFLFRFIFGLIVFFFVILAIAIPVLIAVGSVGSFEGLEQANWALIFFLIFGIIILLIPIIIISALIDSFTNNFVVPTMYVQNLGVIPAWKRYWRTLRLHVWDTVRFILMKFVLGLAGGVISFAVALFTLIPFALIGLIIGGLVYLILTALNLAVGKLVFIITAVSIPILILIIPLIFIMLCLMLPLAVFFRVYTLMFLGACDPELTVLQDDRKFPEYPWYVANVPT